jgi:hypothetical protein
VALRRGICAGEYAHAVHFFIPRAASISVLFLSRKQIVQAHVEDLSGMLYYTNISA